jgi:hypothetical protein
VQAIDFRCKAALMELEMSESNNKEPYKIKIQWDEQE